VRSIIAHCAVEGPAVVLALVVVFVVVVAFRPHTTSLSS
jgi:hypothetical protein